MVVPTLVVALLVVEGGAHRAGARAPRRGVLAAQGVALATWLLVAAARSRLELVPAPVVAAALVVLLGTHLVELLPRLRPLLGESLGPRPHAAFFWLPLVAYLALIPWSTSQRPPDGDEPYYLLVAHSIAYDGDAELSDEYLAGDSLRFMSRRLEPQPGDPVGHAGERYSRHNVLLPLLLALPYRLAGATGAFAAMAAFAAALAWWTLRLARHRFADSPGGALLAWALLAFTPPVLLYSHQVWVEVPAALLIVLAVDALETLDPRARLAGIWTSGEGGKAEVDAGRGAPPERRAGAAPATRRLARLVFWAAVILLPLLKLRFAGFAALLVALAWWRGRRQARALLVAGLVMVTLFAAILAFNHARFGAALKTYGLEQLLPDSGAAVVLARALGLFFDLAFGLFAAAPLWALLVPAVARIGRLRPRLTAELAFLVVPYLLLVSFRREWFGGWSPPFRYGLAVLPLLALGTIPLFAQRRSGGARLLVAALAAGTAALTVLWVAVPGWTYNFADGGSYLLAGLGRELGLDVARLLPSAIRLRTASWWWPLAATALLLLAWRWPRRTRPGLAAVGVALCLAAPAAAVVAAARLPTRVVELEDAQVSARGGARYPETWTFDRGRFRGGWWLDAGSALSAPVVSGGTRARLAVWCRAEGPARAMGTLRVSAGGRPFATLAVAPGGWRRFELGPVPWPAGATLTLETPAGTAPVVVDRVELSWLP